MTTNETSPEPSATPPQPIDPGDRYELLGEIGRGGMAAIELAFDRDARREVAIKTLLGRPDDDALGRFVQEGQVTAQLEHPNIVPVHDVAVAPDGQVYFTMKRVRGDSLATLIRQAREAVQAGLPNPLTLTRRLDVFRKVLDAVGYAHSRGVIHRDLKPANIMVGEFGEVLVMDWGLARILQTPPDADAVTTTDSGFSATRVATLPASAPLGVEPASIDPDHGYDAGPGSAPGSDSTVPVSMGPVPVTRTADTDATQAASGRTPVISDRLEQEGSNRTVAGRVMGTPGYMSVEQARGSHDLLDPRSDVYSLGAILYELLTLSRPFQAGTPGECLALQISGPPEPAARRVARDFGGQRVPVPRELGLIARRCLQVRATDRYPGVSALREDIEAFINNEPVSVAPDNLHQRFIKWVRRRPTMAAVSAMTTVLVVCVALVVVVMVAREGRQSAARELAESRAETEAAARQLAESHAEIDRVARRQAEADAATATALAEAEAAARERQELEALAREGRLSEMTERLLGRRSRDVTHLLRDLSDRWQEALRQGGSSTAFFESLHPRQVDSYIEAIETLVRESDAVGTPYHTGWHLHMLGLLYHMGRPRDQWPKALYWYTRAIEAGDAEWMTYGNRGIVRQLSGDTDGALEDFEVVMGMNPTPNISSRVHWIRKLKAAEALLEADPGDVDALMERGTYYYRYDLTDSAIRAYTDAITAGADDHRAWYYRGLCYRDLDRYPEAVADLREAAKRADQASVWVSLADILRRIDEDGEAVEAASRALELEPDEWRALVNRGYAREELGDRLGALEDFRAALRYCDEEGWQRRIRSIIHRLESDR